MSSLVIPTFLGTYPRRGSRLLEENIGVEARNVQARTGYLTGRSADLPIQPIASVSTPSYIYRARDDTGADHYLEFMTPNVSVVKGPLTNDAYDRYYFALEGQPPQYNTMDRIVTGLPPWRLGMPRTSTRPNLVIGVIGSPPAHDRFYVVTYVDIYGHESAPTNPRKITCNEDAEIDISWTTPPGWGSGTYPYAPLLSVKIWRTISGTSTTDFFFVGSADITDPSFIDALADDEIALNETLASTDYDPPPSNMIGFVSMPNGFLAGWRGRDLFFSEPFRPHAWPAENTLTVDFPIVGLGVFDQSIAVMTTGTPYICSGVVPNGMSLMRVGPANPCKSRRSIVEVPGAVLYAGQDGLTGIDMGGQQVLTRDLITREAWNTEYRPTEIIAGRDADNTYSAFFAGDLVGFEIDFRELARGVVGLEADGSVAAYNSDALGLRPLMVFDDTIHFGAADVDTTVPYTWRSKEFFVTKPVNFGAMQIDAEPDPRTGETGESRIRIYADELLVFDEVVRSNVMMRLPSGFKAQQWQFELEGDLHVQRLAVAETGKELASV